MTNSHNILALTMGDPAGIGPEIAIKAWLELKNQQDLSFVFIGPSRLMLSTLKKLNLNYEVYLCDEIAEARDIFAKAFPIIELECEATITPGLSSPSHASAVISSIEKAVDLCRSGQAHAVVTNPINKASLMAANFPFPGHTEFLAALSDEAYPVMMLEGEGLRSIPLTRHIPLSDVPAHITIDEIIKTTQITHDALIKLYNLPSPRIAISGLNPHAGEEGALGSEEEAIIKPAIDALKEQGINVRGPLPADTMFHTKARSSYDAAICMYHDQALIPVKMIGFDTGVNITLGLDFIRTSPDHGTALDIAPRYCAKPDSLISALKLAAQLGPDHGRATNDR